MAFTIPGPDLPLLDTPEGSALFARWARAHDAVLSPAIAAILRRNGADMTGVIINKRIPGNWDEIWIIKDPKDGQV